MELASLRTDDAQEARALGRAIDLTDDFALLLVRCDSRTRVRELQEGLTARPALRVEIPSGTTSPLRLLETTIPEGFDGVIYLEGLETWIASDVNPDSVAFFLNLNAGRDRIAADFPHPIVLWAPGYLLAALAQAAPDFFSIRSGYYSFETGHPISATSLHDRPSPVDEVYGLPFIEKLERVRALERLLNQETDGSGIILKADNARLLGELGHIRVALGDLTAALDAYRKAETLSKAIFGEESAQASEALNNAGFALHAMDRLDEALECYRKSERISEVIFGESHPDTAIALNNIGGILLDQGRLEEALEHFRKALEIDRLTLGSTHPNLARVLNNVGQVLFAQGDLKGAVDSQQEAARITRANYGNDHPSIALMLNNMAHLLSSKGDRAGARERYEDAFSILISKNGVHGRYTMDSARNLLAVGGNPVAIAQKVVPEEVVRELMQVLAGQAEKPT